VLSYINYIIRIQVFAVT